MVYKVNLRIANDVISNTHRKMTDHLQSISETTNDALYTFNYSPTIQSLLKDDSGTAAISLSDELRSVSSSTFLTDDLAGIAVFNVEGTYLWGSNDNLFSVDGLPEEMCQTNGNTITTIYQSAGSSSNGSCYAVISPVYNMRLSSRTLGEQLGYTVFTFRTDLLRKNIFVAQNYKNSVMVLTDRNGYPFISTNAEIIDAQTLQKFWNVPSVVKLSNQIYESGWTLYSILPSNTINTTIYPILCMIVITALVMLILMVLFSRLMETKIFIPIKRIGAFMQRVPLDQTTRYFHEQENNELGQMIYFMNQMLDDLEEKNSRLRYLENRRLITELAQKKMEILAYRNQVNPHFLYNTLNCIRGMALENDSWDIAEMTESLSSMFRYAVKGTSTVTVAEELAYVQEYALIISKRFAGRIKINIHAENEAFSAQTIKMALQPLVENAVQHGLEQKPGPGLVKIEIQLHESRLLYMVSDNGVGISPERLEELRASIRDSQLDRVEKHEAEQHIGLPNLARRLHLLYGSNVCLTIDSTLGNGTTVKVSFPQKEEHENV